MAVTEVDPIIRQTGAQQGTNSTIYRVVYRVKVNDVNDGASIVMAAAGVPQPGSTYSYGNEADANTKLYSRTPSRDPVINGIWYVVVEWIKERLPNDANFDYEGFPRIIPGHRIINETLKRAKLLDIVDPDGNAINPAPDPPNFDINDVVTPANSAGVVFRPAIERRVVIPTYTVQWYRRTWVNTYSTSIGKVNDDNFTLSFVDPTATAIFNQTYAQRELLLADVNPSGRAFQNQFWYLISMEFWHKEGGWYNDELDRGLDVHVAAGDDDGFDNTISADDLIPGVPNLRRLKDVHGNDLREPVLFDGEGKALDPQDPAEAVYLRFSLDESDELDFDTLNVGS